MDLKSVHKVYFLGIGGIGMSAIARYFLWLGYDVSGYDRVCTPLTLQLEQEGMTIHYDDNPEKIPANIDLVVYTPAIPADNKELGFIKQQGLPLKKRAEVLGMISAEVPTIAVAGTHGKTTVSSMIAHIFKTAGIEFAAFLGGISSNLNSNFHGCKNPQWIVVEADEYDRSFLHLSPHIAVITSIEADHLDIYGSEESLRESFALFAAKVKKHLVLHSGIEDIMKPDGVDLHYYGFESASHYTPVSLSLREGKYSWEFRTDNLRGTFELGMPGRHNVENAVAAACVASLPGISSSDIAKALKSYKGVKRRFEIHINTARQVYIDDYAHHPSEVDVCLASVRELYPGRKVKAVFQPHLFSRTRDFADEFARALGAADELILLDIYPARELPIAGISSHWLSSKIKNIPVVCLSKEELLAYLQKQEIDVLLTMGAGDIDKYVVEITKMLNP